MELKLLKMELKLGFIEFKVFLALIRGEVALGVSHGSVKPALVVVPVTFQGLSL